MELSQGDTAELIIEIKLQINEALYERGIITDEIYHVAKEKIIAGK